MAVKKRKERKISKRCCEEWWGKGYIFIVRKEGWVLNTRYKDWLVAKDLSGEREREGGRDGERSGVSLTVIHHNLVPKNIVYK